MSTSTPLEDLVRQTVAEQEPHDFDIWTRADMIVQEFRDIFDPETVEPEEYFAYLASKLSSEQIARIVHGLLAQYFVAGGTTIAGRKAAVDFGQEFGPDEAQGFYHFAVAVTRNT